MAAPAKSPLPIFTSRQLRRPIRRADAFLTGYWPLDEQSGVVAYDRSGWGNHGTFGGAPLPTRAITNIGQAVNFASSGGNKIDLGTSQIFNTAAITMSAWIRPPAFTNSYSGIIVGESTNLAFPAAALLLKSNGTLAIYMGVAGTGYFSYDGTGTYTLTANEWVHLIATYTAGPGAAGYVNGLLDGVSAGTSIPSDLTIAAAPGTFCIGFDSGNSGREFNGSIRDVKLWGRGFSAVDSMRLYQSYFQRKAPGSKRISLITSAHPPKNIGTSFFNVEF